MFGSFASLSLCFRKNNNVIHQPKVGPYWEKLCPLSYLHQVVLYQLSTFSALVFPIQNKFPQSTHPAEPSQQTLCDCSIFERSPCRHGTFYPRRHYTTSCDELRFRPVYNWIKDCFLEFWPLEGQQRPRQLLRDCPGFVWLSLVIDQKTLASLSRPIRGKTKSNCELLRAVFLRLASVAWIYFEFWLVQSTVSVCCDWSRWGSSFYLIAKKMDQKRLANFSTNQMQASNRLGLAHSRFPALSVGCFYLFWFLIG